MKPVKEKLTEGRMPSYYQVLDEARGWVLSQVMKQLLSNELVHVGSIEIQVRGQVNDEIG